MSSILKALRKLEEEKRGGKLEAPDLRVDQGQSAVAAKSLLPLGAGVLLGALIVGLLFFLPTVSKEKPAVVQRAPQAPAPPVTVTPAAEPPVAVVTEPPPAPEPAKTSQVPSAPAKPFTPVEPAVSEPVAPKVVRAKPAPADIAEPVAPVEAVVKRKLPPKTAALPNGIKLVVSEIFYQDAVNSMAVVNDLPVMVGSHVDSAVITEIHLDRVLFEIDGTVYPVPVAQ